MTQGQKIKKAERDLKTFDLKSKFSNESNIQTSYCILKCYLLKSVSIGVTGTLLMTMSFDKVLYA